ncbi:hypothetical protein, partial [Pseudomonas cuatrocienegasensis]|uniref:hypothetical protein n=1 Tax=Pseudomonas cuatrocienegasensis TaxID=543360 RepID=UPI001ABF097D
STDTVAWVERSDTREKGDAPGIALLNPGYPLFPTNRFTAKTPPTTTTVTCGRGFSREAF